MDASYADTEILTLEGLPRVSSPLLFFAIIFSPLLLLVSFFLLLLLLLFTCELPRMREVLFSERKRQMVLELEADRAL